MNVVRHLLAGVTVAALSATVAAQGRTAVPAAGRVSDLTWMTGQWVQESSETSVEESWSAPGAGAMLAFSRTIKGGRMTAFEFLRIVERNNGLVYIAQPGGQPPTEFVLTTLESRSATFENPQHDFPKMIRYTLREDGRLEARVANDTVGGQVFLYSRAAR